MKLGSYRKILESTFTDSMDVYRYTTIVDSVDRTSKVSLPETPTYSSIPCRISFNAADNPDDGQYASNPLYLNIKTFCAYNTDIKKGDMLVLRRLDDDGVTVLATYNGTSNMPLSFVTHKELHFLEDGEA